jgi:hypothetical protein
MADGKERDANVLPQLGGTSELGREMGSDPEDTLNSTPHSSLLMPDLLRGRERRRRGTGKFVPAHSPQRRKAKPPSQAKQMVRDRTQTRTHIHHTQSASRAEISSIFRGSRRRYSMEAYTLLTSVQLSSALSFEVTHASNT